MINSNKILGNILGTKPRRDRVSMNNSKKDYDFKCPSCGLKFTTTEGMRMGYKHCGRPMKRIGNSTIVKNNTTINEDGFGNCYFCGEKHTGKPCPDSEYYTKE